MIAISSLDGSRNSSSDLKIIVGSPPDMKRKRSIFGPLLFLAVSLFGYFDGFQTPSRLYVSIRTSALAKAVIWLDSPFGSLRALFLS